MLPANTIHVQGRDPDHETNFDLQMIPVSRCPAKPVEWLWPNRIPIGKVTLLCGDPGLGKSLVALDIAARVSTGAAVTYEADIAAQKLQAQVLANEKPSSTPVAPVSHTGNPTIDRSIAALDNLHRLREEDREYFAAHPPQCATAWSQAVPHSDQPLQPEPQKPVPPRSTKPELNYAFFDQLITALEQTIANSPLAA